MATSKSKGGADIKFDEFIKHVKPDPASTDTVVLMTGYVGESDKIDNIGLYADASLSEHVDIARTDILYSIANSEDPLGGSQLWVKQSAQVNYNDPYGYAQGNMYNDYMQSTYDPGTGTFGAANAVTVGLCPVLTRNVICRLPSRFICPTTASRLVVCTIRNTIVNCPITTVTNTITTRPSLVDGCPSQWGCTTDTTIQTVTIQQTINQQTANFAAGDVYGDYMQNAYTPGAAAAAPNQLPASTTIICRLRPTLLCHSVPLIKCLRITNNNLISVCHPCWPTTTITQTLPTTTPQQTIQQTINQQAPNFAAGDVYGDYMQQAYQPAEAMAGPQNAISTPQLCFRPTLFTGCPSFHIICRPTSPFHVCCITQTRIFTQTPGTLTITRPSAIDGCPSALACPTTTIQTQTINQTINQQFDANYAGGDMYGDYMQNTYQPAADTMAGAAVTTTAPCVQLATNNTACFQPVSIQTACVRTIQANLCPILSYHYICITRNNIRTLCRPCYQTPTTTITITPTTPQQTVVGGFGDAYNPYGY